LSKPVAIPVGTPLLPDKLPESRLSGHAIGTLLVVVALLIIGGGIGIWLALRKPAEQNATDQFGHPFSQSVKEAKEEDELLNRVVSHRFFKAPVAKDRLKTIVDKLTECQANTFFFVDDEFHTLIVEAATGEKEASDLHVLRINLEEPPYFYYGPPDNSGIGRRHCYIDMQKWSTRPSRTAILISLIVKLDSAEYRKPK